MKPQLPSLLSRKIYKTGQTRGADDDVIYQNRVARNSTVLIPYHFSSPIIYPEGEDNFEKGFIVLIPAETYFSGNIKQELRERSLVLGQNCLVFYETRQDWDRFNPDQLGWKPPNSRNAPLGGFYAARIPATTAVKKSEKITRGFTTKACKGAGIRQYEYASSVTLKQTRLQLEAIYWLCFDAVETVVKFGMSHEDAANRRSLILKESEKAGLLDFTLMKKARIIDRDNQTICPLCREKLSGNGFFNRVKQAEGREVPDLTVTDINLFHIEELQFGRYNHKPYNLGWGHHHCNIVTKDAGIKKTLEWMEEVLDRNKAVQNNLA